ncbi:MULTISPECIES: type III secretion system stator protein SctL [unclassified Pseudomonas]|uniref:type III secretion system stator protein SctL n=1 Tax=unclassified Pseudomonas TaxID=196821 RepID=UPI0023623422|nr:MULTISPECIES: type III secretion system stator protein SctL [unclassified Pseudomonas]
MLTRRTLELRANAATLPETHLPRALLADCGRAETVLSHAEAQAAELLAASETACATRLGQLEREFWQRAEGLLDAWQAQRQEEQAALEEIAREVVNAALDQLLAETPPAQRVDALLRQLLLSRQPPLPGQLHCAPDLEAPLQTWCAARPELPWQLVTDHALPPGQMMLRSDTGDFRLDWRHAVNGLQLPEQPGMEPSV